MNIILLTHQKELNKKTNTGSLVVDVMGEKARVVVWDRVKPNAELLRCVDKGSVALLYPSADSQFINKGPDYENYIIIDGTWQQAQKIYNQSPYLKDLPAVKISVDQPSAYHLRRNQRAGCLCTAECAIVVLRVRGFSEQANQLGAIFLERMGN